MEAGIERVVHQKLSRQALADPEQLLQQGCNFIFWEEYAAFWLDCVDYVIGGK